ncbi:MAG TPA: NF038122 family metalloprotease [Acidiphilium sp.]|nr:MAG: hypothetical protein B7Z67_05455 [Acidiphilium sp. 21-60-14]OYV92565.1 MAG: hypothetical protein B7Z57_00620 [Acidiphilium sp. 37-60-79]OZB39093.1 MAG: hypothetical protein B7X48_10400 [Acidiphilium sp. 34-60-192]HQT90119.1 NF038122 family metalloprotease [Acidiphilium sp.]HQU25257.1 NF038122 family metalloprotease [Acidiphilium sp.]
MARQVIDNLSHGITLTTTFETHHNPASATNSDLIALPASTSAVTSLLSFDTAMPIMPSETGITLPSGSAAAAPHVSNAANSQQAHMSIAVYFAPVTNTNQAVIPPNMRQTMIEAANYLGSRINDPVTVTIAAHGVTSGLAGGAAYFDQLPYSSFISEMAAHDPAAVKYYPATLPPGVYDGIQVSSAEEQAWGLSGGAGQVGKMGVNVMQPFYYGAGSNVTSNSFDLFGIVLHELSHALGRDIRNGGPITYYNTATSKTVTAYDFSAVDFFRFTAPGVLQLNNNASLASNAKAPYFSVDNGKTALATFAGSARTDFNYLLNDPFNGYAAPGYASNTLTPLDTTVLTLMGFNINCFAQGTRILSREGEVPVERLRLGDELVLHGGGTAPICWIGRRAIEPARHPQPTCVNPIRIKAGALMEGVPRRDLILSPDHALYLDGALIPAKALINGTTIRQEQRRSISYFHIELPHHGILYAEGTPSESFLDTGNRANFVNGGAPVALHPDFAQTMREHEGCAPFHESGPIVQAVRERLLARARLNLTSDPAITLRKMADGSVTIISRSAIPGHVLPDPRDLRRLGVKIAAILVGGDPIPLDHPDLCDGWHGLEPDGRWTNGRAIIPAHLLNDRTPSVQLSGTAQYSRRVRTRTQAA